MFTKSIHKKLLEDFMFIKEYDFHYSHDSKYDYVGPSIFFEHNKITLEIGYDFDRKNFFIIVYDNEKKINANSFLNINKSDYREILKDSEIKGRTYKEQVGQVQEFLKNYLEKR